MNEPRINVENFDLGRHAVVEASAGTGKTHTIERLVLRLLAEDDVPLDQILVVTFTEKATGDLKARLRSALDHAIHEDVENAPVFKTALDQFDQAPVFTIHGFCQRMLQEYALEQGQDFRAELVDDSDLLKTLLREIQRKDWRTQFGAKLRDVLEKANYGGEEADKWDRKVLELAKKFKPRCGHQLRPAFVPDWWKKLDEVDGSTIGQLEIHTVQLLHQRLREFKRQRGLQSFDDMIAALEESLDAEKNDNAESFLKILRERFRYGIVDEFQDTDPLQWRIFRRIFLDAGKSKLFIVGDPKQAIFSFRGADLPTYLQAAREMAESCAAIKYPLDENWRSEPNLLDGLNCLFEDGAWFHGTGIGYVHVHACDDDLRQSRSSDDRTGRAALTIVNMTHVEKLKLAHKHYARFIAYEISRMLAGADGKPLLSISVKNRPPRPIDAGDFCLLVMKRAEADPIMEALDRVGLPYSFYKQTGLWQSEEAVHLEVLLQTLANPEERTSFRKALLTCFFRVKPEALAHAPDVPMQHPARQLFQTWLGHVENRAWSALFHSLLEDTGLLFQAPGDGEAQRRLANLRQLLATLEQVGHGFNHDLLGLLDWMRGRRQQRDTGDAEFQPVEAGRPKVKIMTIHASKGLEFPIVFLAGGFTQWHGGGSLTTHHEAGRVIHDLNPDADAIGLVRAERLDEQRRLLYVALTRAIFKLYIPKVRIPRRSGGYFGPVATILLPALDAACPDKHSGLVADIVTPPLAAAVPPPRTDTAPVRVEKSPINLHGPLFPVIDGNIGKRRIAIRSFSSMTRHHLSPVGEGSSFGDQAPRPEDEVPTPLDREDPLRGPVFGDMVHNVLENIDFAEVGRAEFPDALWQVGAHARQVIDQEVKKNITKLHTRTPIEQLDEACRQQIASLVWHALRTPLAALGCRLCDIAAKDRLAEVEFLFPERTGVAVPAERRWEEGFVTGFMDLLCRRHNRYYLVDWKTNLLPAYGREQLERSMADSDYHRQYSLYLHAVRRWLTRAHGGKFSFLERLGGVYYLYLRGLNGRDDSAGVFFHRPTEQDLELNALLNR